MNRQGINVTNNKKVNVWLCNWHRRTEYDDIYNAQAYVRCKTPSQAFEMYFEWLKPIFNLTDKDHARLLCGCSVLKCARMDLPANGVYGAAGNLDHPIIGQFIERGTDQEGAWLDAKPHRIKTATHQQEKST